MEKKLKISGGIPSLFYNGLLDGLKTAFLLIRIMVPVSFAVAVLNWIGLIEWFSAIVAPAMRLIGLSGGASVVFVSSMLLNIYSAIAVMDTLSLTAREITILALMCLTAHNMIVETAIMKKTNSSAIKMVFLRILSAIAVAWVVNILLPQSQTSIVVSAVSTERPVFLTMLGSWGLSTLFLVLKVTILVVLVMVVYKILEEFKIILLLSKLLAPIMKAFGLRPEASFLWIIINVAGYAYGAGILCDRVKNGKMRPQEADLFNHHAAMMHSLLEDTVLFLTIGVSLFWLLLPRLVMALVVVWVERLRRIMFKRSFRIGTI